VFKFTVKMQGDTMKGKFVVVANNAAAQAFEAKKD
jgi:hypothetical protein